jgi:hypothetical protein
LRGALSRHLGRLSRRALLWKASRATAVFAGALSVLLLASAFWCGPSLSTIEAVSIWIIVPALALALFIAALGKLKQLRGAARARLLEPFDRQLSRRVQSAAELSVNPNGSPELVRALMTSVRDELDALPLGRAIQRPRAWGQTVSSGVVVTGACAAILAYSDQAQSGLYALTHPGLADSAGTAIGLWVDHVSVEYRAPDYLGGASGKLRDPRRIEVPEGTRLSLRVVARTDSARAVLALAERTLPFSREDDRTYALELTAERSGPISLRALVDDRWITDPGSPSLSLIVDTPPQVTLDAPADDRSADANEPVPFVYRVRDDHAVAEIDLVVQLGPKRERRLALSRLRDDEREHAGDTHVTPADFGAEPGAAINVWIEARDRDAFKGPNVGRSAVRTITISSVSNPRGAPIALVTEARDQALDTLGHRLESELSDRRGDAAERTTRLAGDTRRLVSVLERLSSAYAKSTGDESTADTLRDMVRRLGRLSREEKEAASAASEKRTRKADDELVKELEDDVLWLTDLIGRARLSDAQHVLDQLEATRARMRALLDELKSASDPVRKQQLLEEIARARAEVRELAQRLSQAQGEVPSDFVNYDALAQNTAEDPLDTMEKALEAGDMEAVERALSELDAQIDGLRGGLGQGREAFASARISPRQRALAQARAEIDQLKRAQQSLANETARNSQGPAQPGDDRAFRQQAERLAAEAEKLEQRTRALAAGRSQSVLSDPQASAVQRLRDARDALARGDGAEARAMARRAARDLEDLASEMNLDARMFPGPDGEKMSDARKASSLSRDVSEWASDVDENLPAPEAQTTPQQQQALKEGAEAQGQLGREARRVGRELDESSPPGVQEGLERVQESMRSASQSMERGDAKKTQSHQRDALDRLNELSERLRQEQEALGGSPSQPGGDGDGGRIAGDEKVTIPGESDDPRRTDLRRRVLDARRANAPQSYERAVDRYYQEILR